MPIVRYDMLIEEAIEDITALLCYPYRMSRRAIALLLLQGDQEMVALMRKNETVHASRILQIAQQTGKNYAQPLNYMITIYRQQKADEILNQVVADRGNKYKWSEWISYLTMWPLTGIPILLLVLYFGMYQFVGQLGAGIIVDYMEDTIFGGYINPYVNMLLEQYVPWESMRLLIGGEYGIITLGFRYAMAIVLPIVGAFFVAFSIIEDSGYLPRLAMLVDGVFKGIGLNGRAVIPMVLGFGCGTMATMVTRTLETSRERLLATFLLALAIPCSAQLGLILGLLASYPAALVIWCGVIGATFILAGSLAAKLVPGERPVFYMELPPLRIPNLSNVVTKSYTRMYWYFMEVLPLFVAASVVLWVGKMTGGFDWLLRVLEPVVHVLGLPGETAKIFVFGFFRRDYGAAGLYDLITTGFLNPQQLLITATVLTLFVPCIAQFAVMVKERGWLTALMIAGFVFPFAYGVGYMMHKILSVINITF
jgi:ferrous iron transport protein B